jgi:hypothetical protein
MTAENVIANDICTRTGRSYADMVLAAHVYAATCRPYTELHEIAVALMTATSHATNPNLSDADREGYWLTVIAHAETIDDWLRARGFLGDIPYAAYRILADIEF